MKYWIILMAAILFETLGTTALKQSSVTGNHLFSVVFIISLIASLGLLWYALKGIDLSLAYAIWAGVGVVLVTFIGIIVFKEPVTLMKVGFVLCIVVGVVGLKLSAPAH